MNENVAQEESGNFAHEQKFSHNGEHTGVQAGPNGGSRETAGYRAGSPPELVDVADVAQMLSASERTVWRLADAGKIPAPVRIGRLVRWSRQAILAWIVAGCPSVRKLRVAG
jgi:excisionase family DNA binding protein